MSDLVTRWGPYAVDGGADAYGAMEEDAYGDYVNFEDHTARITALEAQVAVADALVDAVDSHFRWGTSITHNNLASFLTAYRSVKALK